MTEGFKPILSPQVDAALEIYSKAKGWQLEDQIMQWLKKKDPDMLDIPVTRVKALTINAYYSANVPFIYIDTISEHIGRVMPKKANRTKVAFVELLIEGFLKRYDVFASKFSHFFIDEGFPILDNLC
jgi:hypothetical protein